MFCSQCGSLITEQSKFCGSCGNPQKILNVSEKKEMPVVTSSTSPQSSNFLNTYLKVTTVVVIILGILFWIAGSYEEDGNDAVIGTIIISAIISLLITLFINGRSKSSQKSGDEKKSSFFGNESILDSDTEEVKIVKRRWNNFIKIFWLIFFLKILLKGGEGTEDESTAGVIILFQLISIGAMVITMGYYSYRLSGKKSYWLYGLLGLIWIAIIGIFIGYWQVQRIRDEKLGRKTKVKSFQLSK